MENNDNLLRVVLEKQRPIIAFAIMTLAMAGYNKLFPIEPAEAQDQTAVTEEQVAGVLDDDDSATE